MTEVLISPLAEFYNVRDEGLEPMTERGAEIQAELVKEYAFAVLGFDFHQLRHTREVQHPSE